MAGPDEDEPLLPESDDTATRVRTPGQYRQRGPGCAWQLLFLVVMAVLGWVAAANLRSHGTSTGTTLDHGTVAAEKGAVAWKVKAAVDPQRARCINLYVAEERDALTGGCLSAGVVATGADVHEAPIPGSKAWVIFGLAPKRTRRVRLPLTDGTTKVLSADSNGSMADRYYVWTAPAGVHTSGDATWETT